MYICSQSFVHIEIIELFIICIDAPSGIKSIDAPSGIKSTETSSDLYLFYFSHKYLDFRILVKCIFSNNHQFLVAM